MMQVFHTESRNLVMIRTRRGLDHTNKTSFNFRHIGFKIWTAVIVPVYIEFTGVHRLSLTASFARLFRHFGF